MSDSELSDQIAYVKSLLDLVGGELAAGLMPSEGVEDLNTTIDDVRRTTWSILTADTDYRACLGQFRLRRTTETLRRVVTALDQEQLGPRTQELGELAQTLQDLAQAMQVAKGMAW